MLLTIAQLHAGAPQVGHQAPGFFRLMVGDAEITALLDGTHTFPIPTTLQALADGADAGPRRLLEEVHPGEAAARLAEERLGLPSEGSINAFLVNLDGRLTLIDTGAGELYERNRRRGPAGRASLISAFAPRPLLGQ